MLAARPPRRSSGRGRLPRSIAHGTIRVENILPGDYERMAELVATYADLSLGMVDASVVAVAERLGITTVFTVNRRDFSVVRPDHVAAFDLLPDR